MDEALSDTFALTSAILLAALPATSVKEELAAAVKLFNFAQYDIVVLFVFF